uniref:Ubiquitin-like domain-containing protein n=1 Tax=Neobodo designis TaxID=312471 RepID=A0A7S1W5P4_NEODS|mmetsp:Transcript_53222/g.163752  ORF Transcript_53222/g.163752 Transcript_53222/m.163752 type:complete len:291 (+) Transcript_53222:32-904(+)
MGKHVIRLRAVLPSRNEVQVEISEDATIKDLKRLVCSKVPGLHPNEIRILQKSMDLNDKGTLEYFRVFDGTKVDVVKKPPATDAPKSTKKPSEVPTKAPPSKAQSTGSPSGSPPTAAAKAKPTTAPVSAASSNRRPARVEETSSASAPTSRPGTATTRAAGASRDSSLRGAGEKRVGDAVRSYDRDDDSSDGEDSAVLDRVARSVAELKRDLQDSSASTVPRRHHDASGAGDPVVEMLQRRNASLEDRLRRSEERCELANQRIQELEQTVRRYQLLMRKVSVSMASAGAL